MGQVLHGCATTTHAVRTAILARPSSAGRPWIWATPRSPPRWGVPDRARFTSTHAMGGKFLSLSWNERPRSKLTMGSLMIHKKWPRCPRRKSFEIMRKSAVSKPSNAARSWTRSHWLVMADEWLRMAEDAAVWHAHE